MCKLHRINTAEAPIEPDSLGFAKNGFDLLSLRNNGTDVSIKTLVRAVVVVVFR
jgi:hypothetical protein